MQTKKFQSEKALFAGIVIWSTVILLLFLVASILIVDEFDIENLISIILLGVVIFFLLWLWFDTNYELSGNKLIYKSGPLRGSIDIDKILYITKNKTLWTGLKPALGLHGLIIRYNTWDDIYISPANQDMFIAELLKANHNIEVRE